MEFTRKEAPYLTPSTDVANMMLHVLLALVPAALAHVWYFGPGLLFNLIIAAAFCLGGEALMMQARGRDPAIALADYSALVTAALLAFALPSLTPWWVTATGALFGVIVAKHLLRSNIGKIFQSITKWFNKYSQVLFCQMLV